jgi:hypothetical protein
MMTVYKPQDTSPNLQMTEKVNAQRQRLNERFKGRALVDSADVYIMAGQDTELEPKYEL